MKHDDSTKDAPESEGWDRLGAAWREAYTAGSDATGNASDGLSAPDPTGADARARAATFARSIRRRNALEIVAGVVVVANGIGELLFEEPWLLRACGLSMALGALWVIAVLVVRGRNRVAPDPYAPTQVVVEHERSELERQAALLDRVWLWYLLPFVPALLLAYGHALLEALRKRESLLEPIALFALSVVVLVGIHLFNRRKARTMRAKMHALFAETSVDGP